MIHPGIGRMLLKDIKTKQGPLIMPDTHKKEALEFEVVEVGLIFNEGVKHEPIVKPGDKVYLHALASAWHFHSEGKKVVLAEYVDIACWEPKEDLIDPESN